METWQEFFENVDSHTEQSDTDLLPLPEYRLISIIGSDSTSFLQGQCTCDMNQLKNNLWLLGAHCNPKGRMHSSFHACRMEENEIFLRVHQSIINSSVAALNKYAIFSKAEVNDEENHLVFALKGANIERALLKLGAVNCELKAQQALNINGGKALVLSESLVECWISAPALKEAWPQLLSLVNPQTPDNSQNTWTLEMIRAGRSEIREAMVEKLIPQEMNYQLIEGISFDKGCYTGQEIIARMHYRAQLKKHMYRAKVSAKDGVPLMAPLLDANDKNIGHCLACASVNQNEYELLILANDDALDDKNVVLETPSRINLQWLTLPYAIS